MGVENGGYQNEDADEEHLQGGRHFGVLFPLLASDVLFPGLFFILRVVEVSDIELLHIFKGLFGVVDVLKLGGGILAGILDQDFLAPYRVTQEALPGCLKVLTS